MVDDLPLFSGIPDKATTRRCRKCGKSKNLTEFYKHPASELGRDTKCKECAKIAEYNRRHDPDRHEMVLERDRQRNKKPERRERRNNIRRARRKLDPAMNVTASIYGMLKRLLNYTGAQKNTKTYRLLGYGPDKLVQRLECQFLPGMGWHNRDQWHIDHKKPIKAFVDQGVTNPAIVNALCNLRPIWDRDNIVKGAKWVPANDNKQDSKQDRNAAAA